jgi:hypothetical protein
MPKLHYQHIYFRIQGILISILFKLGVKSISHGADPDWKRLMMTTIQSACRDNIRQTIGYDGWIHGWLRYANQESVVHAQKGTIEITWGEITGCPGTFNVKWETDYKTISLYSRKVA